MLGITLNYAAAQVVNFVSKRDMILGADTRDVITVRTERKLKRKTRKCGGQPGTDMEVIVSVPEEKVYRVSFHKCRRLEKLFSLILLALQNYS